MGTKVAKKKIKAALEANRPVMVEQLVSAEQRAKGDYVIETMVKGEDFPKAEQGKASVVRNRGGSTVERWEASGALDARQMDAIRLYRWAWTLAFGGEQRTTMNWGNMSGVSVRGLQLQDFVASAIEAKETIADMDRHIFAKMPRHYFDLWQNVVIFDEPAGAAGGRLGFAGRDSAATAALTSVRMICDLIGMLRC